MKRKNVEQIKRVCVCVCVCVCACFHCNNMGESLWAVCAELSADQTMYVSQSGRFALGAGLLQGPKEDSRPLEDACVSSCCWSWCRCCCSPTMRASPCCWAVFSACGSCCCSAPHTSPLSPPPCYWAGWLLQTTLCCCTGCFSWERLLPGGWRRRTARLRRKPCARRKGFGGWWLWTCSVSRCLMPITWPLCCCWGCWDWRPRWCHAGLSRLADSGRLAGPNSAATWSGYLCW